MSSSTVYLITGANRGIGKGLVETYLSRPNHTLIAGVRDPNHPSSIILNDLPKGPGSSVVVVKIDSSTESDAAAAVKLLQSTYNITKVDVVIANAGIVKSYKSVATVSVAEVQEHIAVNAIGPLVLFQAVHPLLQNSARPKFVVVSSLGGSIGSMERVPLPLVAYGSSKALVNYFVRKIHFENESLIAFPIHPGDVDTDMGIAGYNKFDLGNPPTTVKESVDGLITVIDGATRAKTSGHFACYTGKDVAW